MLRPTLLAALLTAAVDAITGKQIWRVKHEYPPETLRVVCCGIVNRGAAIYEGMIIRALMDDRLTALDAKSGKEIWTVKSPEPVTHANGYVRPMPSARSTGRAASTKR